jgi:hypothetical protein
MPAKKTVVQKSSTSEPQLIESKEVLNELTQVKPKKVLKKNDSMSKESVVSTDVTNSVVTQEGGKKKLKKPSDIKVEKPSDKVEKSSDNKVEKPMGKSKKMVSQDKPPVTKKAVIKKGKKSKQNIQEGGELAEGVEDNIEIDKQIRSFKVKLPNKEEFEGRFTGLTPYQAANKALSKYFREVDNPDGEVTFCIIESTRKSKKTVYTYVGKRYKLEVPVVYKIQDGREIVKNFKNSLKKVKKADLIQ